MLEPVAVTSCGLYHPYRYLGEKNPLSDRQSKLMMDFKDENNRNHRQAVNHFSQLAISVLRQMVVAGRRGLFIEYPFIVSIVPSHMAGRISPSLLTVAERITRECPRGQVNNCLARIETVPSAHREGGDRSILGHMSTIRVQNDNLQGVNVLLLDDVKTTGGSLSACYYLLESAGAGLIMPFALLETANYEE
ncbi:phosphoribosyltransferase [Dickeya oryzae]|uniref:Phosphoribosyltransferase n=1 Tax=Dickeya oryzae TaxID=1240404 RepID=A0AB39ICP1_9GAMM|nr:phosphoribosyltransferase [Dickeya oryzae]MCA6993662.1 phosphoribosyltransferase [Dickeya oryzae]